MQKRFTCAMAKCIFFLLNKFQFYRIKCLSLYHIKLAFSKVGQIINQIVPLDAMTDTQGQTSNKGATRGSLFETYIDF